MSYQLQKHILSASNSKNYPNALNEWILESDKIANKKGFCICGRKINNIYYARNVINKNMIMLGTTCVKEIQVSNSNFIFRAKKITQLFQKGFYKDLNIPEYCRQVFHDYLFSDNLDIKALHQLWEDYPLYRDTINNLIQQKMYLFSIKELEALSPPLKQEYKDAIHKQTTKLIDAVELIRSISSLEELEALSPPLKQEYKDAIHKRMVELIRSISSLEELEALSPPLKQEYADAINKQKKAIDEKMLIQKTKNIQRALWQMKPICIKCKIAQVKFRLSNKQFNLGILNEICIDCKPIYEKFLSRFQKKDLKKAPISKN